MITDNMEERGESNMIVEELIKRGKIKGLKEGKIEGKLEDAVKMYEKGFSLKEITDITELSEEDLKKAGIT